MPVPQLSTDRPLRVLSLAGGGFLGLYTAAAQRRGQSAA